MEEARKAKVRTVKIEFLRNLKDLWYVCKVRRQALNIPSVEAHTRFDKVQVMLFQFAPFHSLPFALPFPKLCQLAAKAVVDLSVSVPELCFGFVFRSRLEVEEDIVLAGMAIPANWSAIVFLRGGRVRTLRGDLRYWHM